MNWEPKKILAKDGVLGFNHIERYYDIQGLICVNVATVYLRA